MMEQETRHNTDFKVTIDQIGQLERALLAMRGSAVGSAEVLDTIALIQYQEIVRLRSELDAVLGFDVEEASDLVMTLRGPYVGIGTAPSSVVASMLNNLRVAVSSVSSYVTSGRRVRGGRFPEWISSFADFDFAGLASGSVRISLNLPEPQSLLPDISREPIERSVELLLQTVNGYPLTPM